MPDTIYEPKTGLHYKLVGDYYIPLVEAPIHPKSVSGATAASNT